VDAAGAALDAGAGVLLLPQAAATRAAIVSRMGTAERCTCRCMVGSSSETQGWISRFSIGAWWVHPSLS
jgi:hypothetical protein